MKARRFDRLQRLMLRRRLFGSGALSRSGVRHALSVVVHGPSRLSLRLRAHGVALTGWSVLTLAGWPG
jgi:hypothetical protein